MAPIAVGAAFFIAAVLALLATMFWLRVSARLSNATRQPEAVIVVRASFATLARFVGSTIAGVWGFARARTGGRTAHAINVAVGIFSRPTCAAREED